MNKFCTQCGAAAAETARFCNKCGERLMPTQPTVAGNAPTLIEPQPASPQLPPVGEKPIAPPNYPDYQPPPAHSELSPNIAGLLCYPLSIITGIIFLSLSAYNKDRFVRFHAYQSIFFFVALVALNTLTKVLWGLIPNPLDNLLAASVELLWLGGTAWLMYQAYLGIMFKMPLIGDLAEKHSLKS